MRTVRALTGQVLRRPFRLATLALLLAAGSVIDATVDVWHLPLGAIVLGFGVGSTLVTFWTSAAPDEDDDVPA